MTARRTPTACRPLLAVLAAGLALAFAGAAQASEPRVGEVSLLIGSAKVVRKDGSVEPLRRGSAIQVGDRVETSANGHVHVRFVDNAAVSVRPESSLEVQAYRFDAGRPETNEVRLRMEQGTSRSISGAATEADKSRFRLNTPIAAIGVRGTDFIVQSTPSAVRATVADGAIVVGALGDGCSAAALGPCGGNRASVLSADMGRLMLELKPGEQMARLMPATETLVAVQGADERANARSAAESAARSAGLLAAEPTAGTQTRTELAASGVLAIAAANVPDLNSRPNAAGQLSWGRWTYAPSINDNVSLPYGAAAAGRHITVADTTAGLFRSNDPTNPSNTLSTGDEGKVDFRLSRAQASFDTGTRTEAASVNGGTLSLDFSRRTFATALAMSSASGGSAELRLAGDVRVDGTFAVRETDQRVAGAISLDGKEAGYLFERRVGGGLFTGRTLWGR